MFNQELPPRVDTNHYQSSNTTENIPEFYNHDVLIQQIKLFYEQVQYFISESPSVNLENKIIENSISEQYSSKDGQQENGSQLTHPNEDDYNRIINIKRNVTEDEQNTLNSPTMIHDNIQINKSIINRLMLKHTKQHLIPKILV